MKGIKMTPEIQAIHSNLVNQKNSILEKLKNAELINDEIDFDGDETDEIQSATIEYISNNLSGREVLRLRNIEVALSKIKDGSFGFCEECGDCISLKRLSIFPETTICIGCAEENERLSKSFRQS